jgi:signal transduction histidine kinase/YesN/AraC family two-component response regulator
MKKDVYIDSKYSAYLFSALTSISEELVALLDSEYKIIYMNKPFTDFLEIENYELCLGKSLFNYLHNDNTIKIFSEFLLKYDSYINTIEFEINGECRYFKVFSGKIQGKIKESYIQMIDITDFVKGRKDAETVNRTKSEFLVNMSHEMRTPMNTILGMSSIMPLDNLSEIQIKYFNDIKKMSNILLNIINDILDFSKIEAEKLTLVPVNFLTIQLFDSISSISKFMAMEKNIEFIANIDEKIPQALFCDENRLRQIYTNIVSNAIKYTRTGFVKFDLKSEKFLGISYLTAIIEDSGIGIKKENLGKIFQTFEQVDIKKNRSVIGTGLGLAIAKKLVALMKGSIEVKSKYGKGSTFIIRIPLVQGNIRDIEFGSKSSDFVYAKNKSDVNILVVDDISANITVASGFFERHNIKPDSATSGIEAIQKICNKKYDIVFMDHIMPELDGIETTKRIRAMDAEYCKNLVIIALSSNAAAGFRELFLRSGMSDFISKPINADDLNRVLAKWLPSEKLSVDNKRNYDRRIAGVRRIGGRRSNDIVVSNDLLKELSSITGLNVSNGLKYTGGKYSSYIKVLHQFCVNLDEEISNIKLFMKNSLWNDYVIKLHAYKGVFSIIGFDVLSSWAKRLEYTGRFLSFEWNKNTEFISEEKLYIPADEEDALKICIEETPVFLKAMKVLRSRLSQTQLMRENVIPKHKDTPAHIFRILEKLKITCNSFKTKEAQKLALELKSISIDNDTDETFEKIYSLIEFHDYAEAVTYIDMLLNSLNMRQ